MNQLLAGIILAGSIAGYFYYTSTQAEIKELTALNQAYGLKFSEQEAAITSLQNDFDLQTQGLVELQVRNQEIQEDMNRYLDIFKRHNLTKLAAAKPGLIETRANKGTKNVFDSIEDDSRTIDSLDDGLQLDAKEAGGGTDSNKAGGKEDSTTNNAKSD
jgi:hypothetical protein